MSDLIATALQDAAAVLHADTARSVDACASEYAAVARCMRDAADVLTARRELVRTANAVRCCRGTADGAAAALMVAAAQAVVDVAVIGATVRRASPAEQREAWYTAPGPVTVHVAPRSYVDGRKVGANVEDVRAMSAVSRDMRATTVSQLATDGHPAVVGGRGVRVRLVTPTVSAKRSPSYLRRAAKRAAARGDSNVKA
jgi:hypothetical protein